MLLMRGLWIELVVLVALSPLPSLAHPIVLDYVGTATVATGIFAGQGAEVSGTIHFDSDLVDSGGFGNPNFDGFQMNAGANQTFEMFMTIDLGTASWTTEDNGNPPFTLKNIQQFDGPTADLWFFEIPPDPTFSNDSEARIELRTDGVSDALLPGSGGLTDEVLIPMSENFASAIGFFTARGSTSAVLGNVNFTVDEITVPEPAMNVSVLTAALCLLGASRRRS